MQQNAGSGRFVEGLSRPQASQKEVEQYKHHGSGTVEQHVGGDTGTVWKEGLVILIEACNDGRAHHSKQCIQQKRRSRQAHPKSAKPQKPHGAVAQEVPGFPKVVVENGPACVRDVTEDVLPNPAQRSARVIGAKLDGRFRHNDADGNDYRQPGTDPVTGRATPGLRSRFTQRGNSAPLG